MASVTMRNIRKVYDNTVEVIKGVDLEVKDGEFMVFVGPSGCGKSTMMRMIAGLEDITDGELLIGERLANDLPPVDRGVAMVFQSYALYPHMTVAENMGFGLKLAGADKKEVAQIVGKAAEILHITNLLDRRPKALSGGQRQRVAIGRAIVRKPGVFLFDEPLSNLDANLRVQMRVELTKLHRDLGATTIYVTHDQIEAMTLADRVVVLRDGIIEQSGTPLDLYDRPANQFVAQFIGTPQMNVISAAKIPSFGKDADLKIPDGWFVGLRPENVKLVAESAGHFRAKVELIEALGAETLIYVSTEQGAQLVARQTERTGLSVGAHIGVQIDTKSAHFFDALGRIAALD